MGLPPVVEPSAAAGGSFACPLIGLAHGSRHPGVRGSIDDLMRAASALGTMPAVGAYLDLAEPDLTEVANRLAAEGHRRAVVTPLLFTEAFHARVDVPAAVAVATEASGVELLVSDILGTGDDLLAVVQQSMLAAGIGSTESVMLISVGSSNGAANDAVTDFAERLGRTRRGQVLAAFGTRRPRAADVLPQLPFPTAIVPLFLSPGLLLDPLQALAAERGMAMAAPLGTLAAPVLVERYRQRLQASPQASAAASPVPVSPVR